MKPFTLEMAKELADPDPHEVKVEEWDATVYVRQISGIERLAYIETISEVELPSQANGEANGEDSQDATHGIRAMIQLVQLSVVDKKGARLFEDTEESFGLVAGLPFDGLRTIAHAAAKMNGLDLEADEGKSEPSRSSASAST